MEFGSNSIAGVEMQVMEPEVTGVEYAMEYDSKDNRHSNYASTEISQ